MIEGEKDFAIVGATLIDGTGKGPVSDSAVVVSKGTIIYAGKIDGISIPSGTKRLECSGKIVMPGMMDLHCHLAGAYWPPDRPMYLGMSEASSELLTLYAANHGEAMLRAGFTTVRDLGTFGLKADGTNIPIRSLKRSIELGITRGPRIFVAGTIGMTAGHFDMSTPEWLRSDEQTTDGPWEVRKRVRHLVRCGVDLIKIAGSGGMAGRLEEPHWRNYTLEEMTSICDEAHALGKKVAVHVYTEAGIKKAIDSGADTIEHGFPLDDDAIHLMKEKNLTLVPTLQVFFDKPPGWKEKVPEYMSRKIFQAADACKESFQRAVRNGVKVALGTDITIASPPSRQHGENAIELELMTRFGMTPLQAIQAATGNAAEALGLKNVGSVEQGKLADILIVDGNPIEDISILKDKTKIIVIKDGIEVSQSVN